VKDVLGKLTAGEGDDCRERVPVDGTFPTATAHTKSATSRWTFRLGRKGCIQCLKCVAICRMRRFGRKFMTGGAPGRARHFQEYRRACAGVQGNEFHAANRRRGLHRLRAVRGCLPGEEQDEAKLKAINMRPQAPLRVQERENWNFFIALPNSTGVNSRRRSSASNNSCGRCSSSAARARAAAKPIRQMLTQLFGDRAVIGNATGCSSIYGGNLPTRLTPWTNRRGPTWNIRSSRTPRVRLGFRVSIDKQKEFATELVKKLAPQLGDDS